MNSANAAQGAAAREHFARGVRLAGEGRIPEAIGAFTAAADADPALAEAWVNLGYWRERLGDLPAAADAYRRACAVQPNLHEAAHNLGVVCTKLGDFAGAVQSLERAQGIKPDVPATLLALANAYRLRNDIAAAEHWCRRTLERAPDLPAAWTNLGNILRAQNRVSAALEASEHALRLAPKSPEAHLNAAMALLVSGQLRAGWPHAEYRHAMKLAGAGREFTQPAWTGAEPLPGLTILLHAEQGYGDALQFLRYVPLVARQSGSVVLEVQRPLVGLAQASFGSEARIVAYGDPLPPSDLHCALPTLPGAFGTDLATIPANVPYLHAAPTQRAQWANALSSVAPRPKRRIGIAWRGNPGHPNDANRSMPLSLLQPIIASRPDVTWFNLKPEVAPDEAALLADWSVVHELPGEVQDFHDTAAVIEELDLVVAVDTSVAHLAGALGRPVWVLLPFAPDWRWLLERSDSPWYPTARLFRQPALGDWSAVVTEVRNALVEWR